MTLYDLVDGVRHTRARGRRLASSAALSCNSDASPAARRGVGDTGRCQALARFMTSQVGPNPVTGVGEGDVLARFAIDEIAAAVAREETIGASPPQVGRARALRVGGRCRSPRKGGPLSHRCPRCRLLPAQRPRRHRACTRSHRCEQCLEVSGWTVGRPRSGFRLGDAPEREARRSSSPCGRELCTRLARRGTHGTTRRGGPLPWPPLRGYSSILEGEQDGRRPARIPWKLYHSSVRTHESGSARVEP
jgi:hypothetical protein